MGFIVRGIKKVVKVVVGVVSKIVGGVFGFMVGGKKKGQAQPVNNLNKSLEPEASRKIVFGRIAAPLDIRFWEIYGTKGEYLAEVVALATHRIHSILDMYIEQDQAITSAGAIVGKYVGVLTRTSRLGVPGQTALTVGSGTLWTASSKFDGCAHMALTWKPDEKKMPNGVPSRYTQIIEGAPVYDPRRDTTVGGSGSHRINDQTTWDFGTLDPNGKPIGRNNALQALWYLIGWRIQNPTTSEMVLVAGRGVLPEDININSFIAGANACEVAGYYTDMCLATDDNHTSNEDKITCDGLIGRLIDPGGLWSYYANVDDTASIAVELTDADILDEGSVTWNAYKGMSDQFNQVVGKFINPSTITLFQAFPYPMVRDAAYETNLGVKKRRTQDFQQVLDNTLAQRLARLKLNEGQYQGEFSAHFMARAMKAQAYSVVRYTSERFGWTKLFRVWRHDIEDGGSVGMLLKEIHPSIWLPGTVNAAINPLAGIPYDPVTQYTPESVVIGLVPMTGAGGTLADGFVIGWLAAPDTVKRSEVRYRLAGVVDWSNGGSFERDITKVTVGPLLSGAIYEAQVRFISIHGVAGPWTYSVIYPANASGQFQLGTTGNVNYGSIAAAGGTADWSLITGAGKPTDYADVTGANVAASVLGQGNGATAPDPQVLNQYVAGNTGNMLRYTLFEAGYNVGWTSFTAGPTGYVYGGSTIYGKAYVQIHTINFTANGQYLGIRNPINNYKTLMRVTAGQRLSVSSGMINQMKPGVRWQFDIVFLLPDYSLSTITPSVTVAQGYYDVWFDTGRVGGFVTVPADATYAYMVLYLVNDTGGVVNIGSMGLFEPMVVAVEPGVIVHPPFSPGPGYEFGADITGINTAAAIAGQGNGATAADSEVMNNYIAVGAGGNRVRYSIMESGTRGYQVHYNPHGLAIVNEQVHRSGGRWWYAINTTFTASSQQISIGTNHGYAPIEVRPNERICVQFKCAFGTYSVPGRSLTAVMQWFDGAGAYMFNQAIVVNVVGPLDGTAVYSAFMNVPAGAFTGYMEIYFYSNAGGPGMIDVWIGELMVSSASPTQTVVPPFSPGPFGEAGADVTTTIIGPVNIGMGYDYTGTVSEGAIDLSYYLSSAAGPLLTGTIYAALIVDEGNIGTIPAGPTVWPFTVTGGVASWYPDQMATDTAKLRVTLSRMGVNRTMVTNVTKVRGAAPPPSGGGGSGYQSSQTSGFAQIVTPWTTQTTVTNRLSLTLPAGKTTIRCVIALSPKWTPKNGQTSEGPWDIGYMLYRNVGTSASPAWTGFFSGNSNPDPYLDWLDEPPMAVTTAGAINVTHDFTGLVAGSTHEFLLNMWVAGGVTTGNTGGIGTTGSVTLSAP